MYLIAIIAALTGLLFGYDASIVSGAMLFFEKTFHLTGAELGVVVSAVPLGALIAALLCGRLSDKFGRKKILFVTAILFILGSILSALSSNLELLIASRFILGISVGLGSFSAPMYIAEISRSSNRGALVTLNQLAITVGIVLAYAVSYALSFGGHWRLMLGAGAIPAIVLFSCIFFIPESPRWLLLKGRHIKAKKVLEDIHGDEVAQNELQQIEHVINAKSFSFTHLIKSGFFKVLMLGIIVSIFTQAVGINAIIYYAPSIFIKAGLTSATSSTLATLGIGIINVVFTLVAIRYLDKLGRRKMLLTGMTGIILSLAIVTILFSYGLTATAVVSGIMACFLLFVACQAIGTGPACWLIPSEIFPTAARGVGMSLSVAFNWGTNLLVALFFPILLNRAGSSWTFGAFLIIAIVGFILFYKLVPETKGVPLETIEKNIVDGKPLRQLGQQ